MTHDERRAWMDNLSQVEIDASFHTITTRMEFDNLWLISRLLIVEQ